MKFVRTEGCHVGLFREFVGTDCRTYGQSNTAIGVPSSDVPAEVESLHMRIERHGWDKMEAIS